MTGFVARLATRLRCTEGQVLTVAIGLVVAVVTGALGLPPVFEDRPLAGALAAPPAAASTSPTTAAPAPAGAAAPGAAAPASPPRPSPGGGSGGSGGDAPGAAPVVPPPGIDPPPDSSAPLLGVPGANGSCAVTGRSIENPERREGAAPTLVWIYEPSGPADGSITGGSCDDGARPAVFIAHGYSQSDPIGYIALIEHLVSVGNIVVYPSYEVAEGSRSDLEASYRVVDAGIVAAAAQTPRLDTSRVGWWGHSHGGGMVPFLVQSGAARGWGERGLWLSIVAQAFTQLVGAGDIAVPAGAESITVAFEHDALADARLGIDVFESLLLPDAQKRHVVVRSGTDGSSPFVAEHAAPEGVAGQSDAVDVLLWRYADLLQTCALYGVGCDADLTTLEGADGTPVVRATVSADPVDVGPFPAVLAECDGLFGATLNPRIERCGPTRL